MGYEEFLKDYNDVLLPEEVQKILHVGKNTIYGFLADGTLRSVKIAGKYRIPKMYLFQFLYGEDDSDSNHKRKGK